jgi:gliding motility-associated-like protein
MKKFFLYFHILLVSFCSSAAYSQVNCTVPMPPSFTLVSVQPETGKTEFTWTPSPSSDVAAYLVYAYHNENGIPRGDIIDTIWNPSATGYIYNSTSSKYFSSAYVVSAYTLPVIQGTEGCPSPFSNVLNTIYVKADIDTCNNRIQVAWNSYPSVPIKVTSYSVLLSADGAAYEEAANLTPDKLSFTLNDFTINSDYCFVIRANLEGGNYSASNKACLTTVMQRPPEWINADFATVNADKKISLSFTVDPRSEIIDYSLERKPAQSGTYQEIARLRLAGGKVTYTDEKADIDTVYNYRLSALNNCNIPVKSSNLCSNLVLSVEQEGNYLKLSWNSYKKWLGIISSYRIFVNSGKGFEEKAAVIPPDSVFMLDYKEIMYEVTGKEICFYISASETSNPYGITGLSVSGIVCTAPAETITVPNVFTPDNDLVNDFFKPVLTFTPLDYHLVISNRPGKILFETRNCNESWDGTANGNIIPQGVCLWFLKVTTPSGKSIKRTGTLTIIRNH